MDALLVQGLVERHKRERGARLERLWRYFRNPMSDQGEGGYRLGQEVGLPARLRGVERGEGQARERVIENDIGWRVQALVDFMFGRGVVVRSTAADEDRRGEIERFLKAVFEANGGVNFFQDMALLGSVYGYVDVLVDVDGSARSGDMRALGKGVRLELVEPPRGVPMVSAGDYRELEGYAVHVEHELESPGESGGWLSRWRGGGLGGSGRRRLERTQLWTADAVRVYEAEVSSGRLGSRDVERGLVEERVNRLGRIPVVHIQNMPQPFFYEGLSEVEPLIPLQDELNTRLSDRANRVTMQSFKMYLGKGIEDFSERPVGPGQMWATDNPEASIEAFGGDASNPSEEAHINEIREAMDKTSGVTPVAAGLIRGRVGNLTSENALRIVLMGLMARTEKKRVTYGAGIKRICDLVLQGATVEGLLKTDAGERGVRLEWPNPLPDSEEQRLGNALKKLEVGVPRERVLSELGYVE